MKTKNLITMAVAGACAWPLLATAGGATHATIMGHWEVVTPSSVDESAPDQTGRLSHLGGPTPQASISSAWAEVITPSSVDESAPWLTAEDRRQGGSYGRMVSLPNPQTPSSPNESGVDHYAQGVQFHADQVAAVEAARIAAAASHTETLAATETSAEVDRLLLGTNQPGEPGEREPVASLTPGLVDSRMSGMSPELREQGDSALPPDNMPLQTGELASGITVDAGSAEAEIQQGSAVQ